MQSVTCISLQGATSVFEVQLIKVNRYFVEIKGKFVSVVKLFSRYTVLCCVARWFVGKVMCEQLCAGTKEI